MRRLAPALLTTAAIALWAGPALACPVCFSGVEENREAFFWTFVLLTTLPLLTIGGVVWWLFRRAAQRASEEAAAAAAVSHA